MASADGAFGILMYHRVAPRIPNPPNPTWSVTSERFEIQLRGLLERGFKPVRLSELIVANQSDRPLPPKCFAVTFDDGYQCVYRHALPILERLKVPATVFLVTAYIDDCGPMPFDDWIAAGDPAVPADLWRPLTTAQCNAMTAGGFVDLGAHTHWHLDYRNQIENFRADLQLCTERLASLFGIERPMFSFPYGSQKLGFSSPAMIDAVRRHGFSCALSTEPELPTIAAHPFGWGRFNVGGSDTPALLAAQLLGWRCLRRRLFAGDRRKTGGTPPRMSRGLP
jgi:peptidoglycan/xylan/chitin deacetylase (PgdA/CDA1 family)